jgi:hypothetical protein
MKTVLALLGAAMLMAVNVFAQADIIIKQRAKEIRDQNNVRQGINPATQPAQPSQPGTPTASTAPTPLLKQNLAKLQADLAAIQANSSVTAVQKQQLTKDLLACAQGASKPSEGTISPLADSLAAAFAQKPLSDTDRGRLVSRLAAVLNPANIQSAQMQAIYADIQAIFQANGMARKDAVKIVDQVKAIAAETQRPRG